MIVFSHSHQLPSTHTRSHDPPPPLIAWSPPILRSVSPQNGRTVVTPPLPPPCSLSPLGSGHRSAGGGKRRFFGLSETAEAEAEAAAVKAELDGGRRRDGVVADKAVAPPAVVGGGGRDSIDAHRALLSLRSDPMRAMLRSGEREGGETESKYSNRDREIHREKNKFS